MGTQVRTYMVAGAVKRIKPRAAVDAAVALEATACRCRQQAREITASEAREDLGSDTDPYPPPDGDPMGLAVFFAPILAQSRAVALERSTAAADAWAVAAEVAEAEVRQVGLQLHTHTTLVAERQATVATVIETAAAAKGLSYTASTARAVAHRNCAIALREEIAAQQAASHPVSEAGTDVAGCDVDDSAAEGEDRRKKVFPGDDMRLEIEEQPRPWLTAGACRLVKRAAGAMGALMSRATAVIKTAAGEVFVTREAADRLAHALTEALVADPAGKVMPAYHTRPHMSNHGPFTKIQLERMMRANLGVAQWAQSSRNAQRHARVQLRPRKQVASPKVVASPLLPRQMDNVATWLKRVVEAAAADTQDESEVEDEAEHNPTLRAEAAKIWRRLPFHPNLQEREVAQIEAGVWNPTSADHWLDWWGAQHPDAALTRWVAPVDAVSKSFVEGALSPTRIRRYGPQGMAGQRAQAMLFPFSPAYGRGSWSAIAIDLLSYRVQCIGNVSDLRIRQTVAWVDGWVEGDCAWQDPERDNTPLLCAQDLLVWVMQWSCMLQRVPITAQERGALGAGIAKIFRTSPLRPPPDAPPTQRELRNARQAREAATDSVAWHQFKKRLRKNKIFPPAPPVTHELQDGAWKTKWSSPGSKWADHGECVCVSAQLGPQGLEASADGLPGLIASQKQKPMFLMLQDIRSTRRRMRGLEQRLRGLCPDYTVYFTIRPPTTSHRYNLGVATLVRNDVALHATKANIPGIIDWAAHGELQEQYREAANGRLLLVKAKPAGAAGAVWLLNVYQPRMRGHGGRESRSTLCALP